MTLDHLDPARARRHREPDDSGDETAFAQDRLRLLASGALHRLGAVTQVGEPDAGPVPHNRLTHSLDVAAIGVRLARAVGANPVLTEIGCLAHDVGHPPFGHNGETVLRTRARAHGLGFEANAQTLRILTRLADGPEPGVPGLNLTRASLDATCKYPWLPGTHRKYGAYPDDAAALDWIRQGSPAGRLCVEAQIMDWADDIANAVHDVSAGLRAGVVNVAALIDRRERPALVKLAAGHFSRMSAQQIDCHTADLTSLPAVAACAGPEIPDAAVSGFAAALTARFVDLTVAATLAATEPGPLRGFDGELVVPAVVAAEVALLKAVHLHFVLRAVELRARRSRQREVLEELFERLLERAPADLDPGFAAQWAHAAADGARVRVVLDQIASYTDRRAVEVWSALPRTATLTCGRPRFR